MELEIKLILYILLGAVAGMLYSLKRVLRLERQIMAVDEKISKQLGVKISRSGSTTRVVRKRVTKKAKAKRKAPKKKAAKKRKKAKKVAKKKVKKRSRKKKR